jgi:hypothetical protein
VKQTLNIRIQGAALLAAVAAEAERLGVSAAVAVEQLVAKGAALPAPPLRRRGRADFGAEASKGGKACAAVRWGAGNKKGKKK